MAQSAYGRWVVDDVDSAGAVGMACISADDARDAVANGDSLPLRSANHLVSAPEFFSPSWLSLAEFRQALDFADIDLMRSSFEYRLVLRLMEQTEAEGYRARIVFWFDE